MNDTNNPPVHPPWSPGDKAIKNPIYVISWKYSDNSAFGIVRLYKSEERAKKDFEMLQEHGNKDFNLAVYEVEQ